jgi:hypothetical protein
MSRSIHRLVFTDIRGRIRAQVIVVPPIVCGPDRPFLETAAAIGADVPQHLLDARGAEGAFVTSDVRIRAIGWQWLGAVLADWAELQHLTKLSVLGWHALDQIDSTRSIQFTARTSGGSNVSRKIQA